jgi:hypothetical protein
LGQLDYIRRAVNPSQIGVSLSQPKRTRPGKPWRRPVES